MAWNKLMVELKSDENGIIMKGLLCLSALLGFLTGCVFVVVGWALYLVLRAIPVIIGMLIIIGIYSAFTGG
jgi:hypothetical protein